MGTTKYRTITAVYGYTVGIYENCSAKLQTNGRHYRLTYGTVKWRGNTGGYQDAVEYMPLDEGRALLRRVRLAQADEIRGCGPLNVTPLDLLTSGGY